ncbi:MAG: RNA methyltransferase [Muribaculaceae bacterium]|nr:RNA methyltransferase [Muribaculaceae bacterium]
MKLIRITGLEEDRVRCYTRLTEAQLRNRLHEEEGIVIAESPKVIKTALQQGWQPLSILCEERHIAGDAAEIMDMCPDDMPVYTGTRELLAGLTGYTLTRGVLCAMRRKPTPVIAELLKDARRICLIDGVCDTTNVGAIFRSAAALGIDAVLLTPTSCDPLNRRAVRVSMGSVFLVPWGWLESPSDLRDYGFKTVAMALRDDSRLLSDPVLQAEPRLAIIMGTEGDGLSEKVIKEADYIVRIPMRHGVDSLNVAAASAVAFYALCQDDY